MERCTKRRLRPLEGTLLSLIVAEQPSSVVVVITARESSMAELDSCSNACRY
jgi:hypothetical protein